jgi:CopG family transcriptional regulator/antitoxin EndoAI
MHRRLNITLPEDTVRLLDRVTRRGNRSRSIALAIEHYVDAVGRAGLRRRLKEGAIRRADRDREIAEAWFHVDEHAWRTRGR